jgi:hypothetical protein
MTDFAGFARGPRGADPPDAFDWGLRTHVYATFARSGKAPSVDDLSAVTGAPSARVTASLRSLAEARELVLDPERREIRMAHPFSAVPTDFSVETPDFTCWANCAWDALGVPAILGADASIRTTCPATGDALEFGVEKRKVVGSDDVVVHLLTPLRKAWEDIGFT